MKDTNTTKNVIPFTSKDLFTDELSELLKAGAKAMLQKAIEQEVADYIAEHADKLDSLGHRLVVRNGHHPERMLQTGIGGIAVKKPKVNDNFVSWIKSKYGKIGKVKVKQGNVMSI